MNIEELLSGVKSDKCPKCLGDGFKIIIREDGTRRRIDCTCKTITDPKQIVLRELTEEQLNEYVPSPYYIDKTFSPELLTSKNDLPENLLDIRFQSYTSFLTQLHSNLEQGVLPKKSYMLVAPKNFGKKTFVFSAIKTLLSIGMKPTKLMTTLEMQNQYFEKGYRYLKELCENHDMLFVSLPKTPFTRELMFLDTLSESCLYHGRPLILICETSVYDLSSFYENIIENFGVDFAKPYQYNLVVNGGFDSKYMNEYKNYLRTKTKGRRTYGNSGNNSSSVEKDDLFSKPTNSTSDIKPNESIVEYKERIRKGEK